MGQVSFAEAFGLSEKRILISNLFTKKRVIHRIGLTPVRSDLEIELDLHLWGYAVSVPPLPPSWYLPSSSSFPSPFPFPSSSSSPPRYFFSPSSPHTLKDRVFPNLFTWFLWKLKKANRTLSQFVEGVFSSGGNRKQARAGKNTQK